jgi:hypothetical protein
MSVEQLQEVTIRVGEAAINPNEDLCTAVATLGSGSEVTTETASAVRRGCDNPNG